MRRKYTCLGKAFFEQIEKLSLQNLEALIIELCKDMEANREKIDCSLSQRKRLLENIFSCNPKEVECLHCIANLVKERAVMLFQKGNSLYEQMYKLWQEGKNENFTDFYIDLSLKVSYEDSILDLDDDASDSDYEKLAEVLNDFHYDKLFDNLICCNERYLTDLKNPYQNFNKIIGNDYWGEPWFFEKFPALKSLPITFEFHNLLFHTHYALQDIIRINTVWSEAKVVWQCIDNRSCK